MSTGHECEVCGAYCDCDMEDLDQPQPDDCEHLIIPGACDADKDREAGEEA